MACHFFCACWCILALTILVQGDYISTNATLYNTGTLGHRPHLTFHSSSEYAPLLQVTTFNATSFSTTPHAQAQAHIFLRHDGTPNSNIISPLSSPLILSAHDLTPVYMNRTFANVFGPRIQTDRGKNYLTFWAGEKGGGVGDGYGLAFDDTYRLAYKISAKGLSHGVHADLHEFAFTGHGTALVTGVDRLRVRGDELRSRYGWDYVLPRGLEIEMLDGVVQEVELETGEVLFEWRALEHVNPVDSFEPMGMGWDAYHINSIEKTQAGNYLISIRHTHSIHLVDGQTGDIIWTLGGAQNDFVEEEQEQEQEQQSANSSSSSSLENQPLLTMAWQHHARFVPGTNESQLTFFDNHVKTTTHGECRTNCSRGLHIALNTTASPPTARLLREFLHPARLQAQSQGNVQILPPPPLEASSPTPSSSSSDLDTVLGTKTNVFIGWGRCPGFTEHTASGATVLDVQISPWHSAEIPDALDNYRAYKMDWVAEPWWDPAIAVVERRRDDTNETSGALVVYASWNGATEVAAWVVRGAQSDDGGDGVVVATSPRTGFETELAISTAEEDFHYRYIWVEALDVRGDFLRASETIDLNRTSTSIAKEDSSSPTLYDEFRLTQSSSLLKSGNATEPTLHTTTRAGGLSSTAIALLSAGLGVVALALTVGSGILVCIRRRRGMRYDSLKASDFDLGPVDDEEDEEDGDENQGDDGVADPHGDRDQDLKQPRPSQDEDRRALLQSE